MQKTLLLVLAKSRFKLNKANIHLTPNCLQIRLKKLLEQVISKKDNRKETVINRVYRLNQPIHHDIELVAKVCMQQMRSTDLNK